MLVPPSCHDQDLRIDIGLASEQGRRLRNEDYVAAYWGKAGTGSERGIVAVAADGVGGHKGGREAAETAVRAFIDGYYNLPGALSVAQAAGRALDAVNGWIAAQSRVDPLLSGMATTFTALVVAGETGHVIHVGDTRVYRLNERGLEQLTDDHTIDTGEIALALHRAVGFEPTLRIDHTTIDLQIHDRFLLCTDGVHGILSAARLRAILGSAGGPAETARKITSAALRAGSMDNASAIIIDILAPPAQNAGEDGTLIKTPPWLGGIASGFRDAQPGSVSHSQDMPRRGERVHPPRDETPSGFTAQKRTSTRMKAAPFWTKAGGQFLRYSVSLWSSLRIRHKTGRR